MTTRSRIRAISTLAAMAVAALALPAAAREVPAELPDPDGKPPATNKPVKVFILMGQSNMLVGDALGRGMVKLLEDAARRRPNR